MKASSLSNFTLLISGLALFSVLAILYVFDPNTFRADVTITNGIDVCDFTKPGGFIDQGTAIDQLNGLDETKIGPEDQHAILGFEVVCNSTSADCSADNGFNIDHSFVKENAELPFSTSTIELVLLASNDETLFDPTVTINGQTQIVNGIRRGQLQSNNQPTGTIMNVGEPVTAFVDNTNLTMYLNQLQDTRATGCSLAVFKIRTDHTAAIQGKVTGDAPGEENGIGGVSVTMSPCPTNSAGLPVRKNGDCSVITDSNGNYTFTEVLPSREKYTISVDREVISTVQTSTNTSSSADDTDETDEIIIDEGGLDANDATSSNSTLQDDEDATDPDDLLDIFDDTSS